jgi:hypothetical protein
MLLLYMYLPPSPIASQNNTLREYAVTTGIATNMSAYCGMRSALSVPASPVLLVTCVKNICVVAVGRHEKNLYGPVVSIPSLVVQEEGDGEVQGGTYMHTNLSTFSSSPVTPASTSIVLSVLGTTWQTRTCGSLKYLPCASVLTAASPTIAPSGLGDGKAPTEADELKRDRCRANE